MKVTYDGCVFDGNQQGPTNKSGIPLYGVVSILTPYSPTVFQNCIFRNNDYQADENGYAILSEGSTVTRHVVGEGTVAYIEMLLVFALCFLAAWAAVPTGGGGP